MVLSEIAHSDEKHRRFQFLYLGRYFRTVLGTFINEDTEITEVDKWYREASEFLVDENADEKLKDIR